MGHCTTLKTKSFHWLQIPHGRPLLKKNQMWLKCVLHKGWSKRHYIIEKDFCGPRWFVLAESCHMMLATYRHPRWASGQLRNLCSTNLTNCGLQWGPFLSISTKIVLRHSFTATTLWITNKWHPLLCLWFVPNDIPLRWSGRGGFHLDTYVVSTS